MLYDRNLFDGRLHFLGDLDDPFERRVAGHDALEEFAEDPFDFAVDQIIDVEFVQTLGAFQLPGAGSANYDLGPVFRDDRVLNDFQKFGGVYGDEVFAGNLGIDVGRIGNAQRIVSMNRDDLVSGPTNFSRFWW